MKKNGFAALFYSAGGLVLLAVVAADTAGLTTAVVAALVLPAASLALALRLWAPLARGVVGVKVVAAPYRKAHWILGVKYEPNESQSLVA